MQLTLTNVTKDEAKTLVEFLWGACVWAQTDDGIKCYPARDIEATIRSTPPPSEDASLGK